MNVFYKRLSDVKYYYTAFWTCFRNLKTKSKIFLLAFLVELSKKVNSNFYLQPCLLLTLLQSGNCHFSYFLIHFLHSTFYRLQMACLAFFRNCAVIVLTSLISGRDSFVPDCILGRFHNFYCLNAPNKCCLLSQQLEPSAASLL